MTAIAVQVGRDKSTISRELRRNAGKQGYRPFEAHRTAAARRGRHHRRRVETNTELRRVVGELLAQRWSPQQISRQLRTRFPDDPAMRLCHESIYQALYHPRISADAALAAGAAPPVAAADRAGAPAGAATQRPAPAAVRAADAERASATLPAR